ncbi:universal stress protein [Bacillaceae bacterium SIJ1]|uniref:universal stress protein n=1 Tax=Litoribacterium kuwaitense TaxID=1398745 RepID=UPI0013EE07EC|nr:universal stress protein [Litoribacterium kuwaitense]NGP44677.1 universal stress protein [Litoribacterium kuwaitense]
MLQDILLAADGSDHSVRAAEKVVEMTGGNGTVEVVYVIDSSSSKHDVLHHQSQEEIEQERRQRMKRVEDVFANTSLSVEVFFLHGEPGPTIVEFANRRPYDCVVIGSRGLNKLQSMVLGSVSHKVAKRVQWPVLIIK